MAALVTALLPVNLFEDMWSRLFAFDLPSYSVALVRTKMPAGVTETICSDVKTGVTSVYTFNTTRQSNGLVR